MRLFEHRSDREILLSIERKLDKLIGEYEMDLFDRIIAGVQALQSGDTAALKAHVDAIDTHLGDVDNEVLGLKANDTSDEARIAAIETGLGKVADAVDPASSGSGSGANPGASSGGATGSGAPSGGTSSPPSGGDTGSGSSSGGSSGGSSPSGSGTPSSPPADGSQSGDQTPDGSAPAGASGAIPTSGPGSETTGQVDTPKTV